ncbi:MAG: hypothetical protein ACR5K7_05885 [Symbiopectobacterium sp.]
MTRHEGLLRRDMLARRQVTLDYSVTFYAITAAITKALHGVPCLMAFIQLEIGLPV